MGSNRQLNAAKQAKQDEFYTQLTDIEKELRHYTRHFQGKVVYGDTDDPFHSNFFKFFASNFNRLGLKKLITTSYTARRKSYKTVLTSVPDVNGDGAVDLDDVKRLLRLGKIMTRLKVDGDFRSPECISLLEEADIVVTNPPFSLFREYVAQLMQYEKKFLIIGNLNAVKYKDVFNLIRENKIWLGNEHPVAFVVPDHYEMREVRSWRDENGTNWRSLGNACWFTNLGIAKRHEELVLYEHYSHKEYPQYDNYDAIEVSKVKDIPMDYKGAMGVPITFLEHYNPEQFEILGKTSSARWRGRNVYERVIIKRKD